MNNSKGWAYIYIYLYISSQQTAYISSQQTTINLQTIDKTKENNFPFQRWQIVGRKIYEKTNRRIELISEICYVDTPGTVFSLQDNKSLELFQVIKLHPFWQRGWCGGTLINLCPTFRQIRVGQRAFILSSSSQLSSAPNNPYAKVAYSATIHRHSESITSLFI